MPDRFFRLVEIPENEQFVNPNDKRIRLKVGRDGMFIVGDKELLSGISDIDAIYQDRMRDYGDFGADIADARIMNALNFIGTANVTGKIRYEDICRILNDSEIHTPHGLKWAPMNLKQKMKALGVDLSSIVNSKATSSRFAELIEKDNQALSQAAIESLDHKEEALEIRRREYVEKLAPGIQTVTTQTTKPMSTEEREKYRREVLDDVE